MIKKNKTPKRSEIFMGGISCLRLQFRRKAVQVRADSGRNLVPARRFATKRREATANRVGLFGETSRMCKKSTSNKRGERAKSSDNGRAKRNPRSDTKSPWAAKIEGYVEPNIGL
jgi:hypothetical protein